MSYLYLRDDGAFCAFLGQVPIKVKGPIECGDPLFPSGMNDGFAVNSLQSDPYWDSMYIDDDKERQELTDMKKFKVLKQHEPIGTAMESCEEGEQVILCFVSHLVFHDFSDLLFI